MRYRVLVVESDPVATNKFLSIFTGVGFVTAVAYDYPEALMQMERFDPHIVVMRSVLPGKDGFQICSEFRNRFRVPVILLGQGRNEQIWERVVKSGAEHYETEPYRYFSLAARVKSILRGIPRPIAPKN